MEEIIHVHIELIITSTCICVNFYMYCKLIRIYCLIILYMYELLYVYSRPLYFIGPQFYDLFGS